MRDKIMAMKAGKLIDSLIAEDVMGWHLGDSWGGADWHTRDHEFAESVFRFRPSTEITAAWIVVEKLKSIEKRTSRNRPISVIEVGGYSSSEFIWQCRLKDLINEIRVEAPTAPEAICKAALLCCLEGK